MDIPEPVKKYWPYMLGGVVGLYVIVKMSGGSSSGGSDYSSVVAAQNAAANQNAALALQSQSAQAAQALEQTKVNASAAIGLMQAQGTVAAQVGAAASGVISSLQAPTVAAINASAAENIATINGATSAAIGSYAATADHLRTVADTSKGFADAIASSARTTAQAVASSNQSIVGQQQALRPSDTPVKGDSYGGTIGLIGTGLSLLSDADVKVNVHPVEVDSLKQIASLEFVAFDYDIQKTGPQIVEHFNAGVLAQQAQLIDPTWVYADEGFLKLHLPTMFMSALHAIAQLNTKIQVLENKVAQNG